MHLFSCRNERVLIIRVDGQHFFDASACALKLQKQYSYHKCGYQLINIVIEHIVKYILK
jgi:hypothetical protein